MSQSQSIRLLNEKLLPAKYFADKLILAQSFLLDDRDFLYMGNRFVIPQSMRQMIMCSLQYGHAGNDSMLSMVADIRWPLIHCEVIDQVMFCEQCLQSG